MRRITYFSSVLVATLLCGALLYGAYAVARQEAISHLQVQQGILARQAAQGIQDFFAHSRSLAESMAQNRNVITLDAQGQVYLASMLSDNARVLRAISRVDERGVLIYSTPDNSVAGRNVSDQEHVQRVLASHAPSASDVFTSVQGYRTIALHVPVFEGERFRGSLGLLLDFDAISRRYLEGVRVAETGYAFVYSQKGVLLYSPVPGLAGKHFTEICQGFPDMRGVIEAMLRGESGEATFHFDRVREQNPETVLKHAVYLPITLEDTFWSICVATPESEILVFLKRFVLYLLPLAVVLLICTVLGVNFGLRHFVLEKEIVLRRQTEAALKESEERYRSVIENISDVFYRTDRDGRLTMISPSGVALAGYKSKEEILGLSIEHFWRRPQERKRMLELIAEHGAVRDFEVELVDKDGRSIQVATSSNFYRGKDGEILGVEGTFRDISQRKRDRAALVESARRFHSLFDNMAEGVAMHSFVRDATGRAVDYRIEEMNHSFERIFEVSAEQVLGKLVTEAFSLPYPPHLEEFIQVAATGKTLQTESFLPPVGKYVAISAAPWGADGFATLFSDITERRHMEEQLLFRALHDPLTGLANRTLCLDRIALAGERARRRPQADYAVVFMDLDRFKIINDSLGHEAGDQLLREVAGRLLACTRRMDTVCRYGGDEFALVLEELPARAVLRTLRRIRESLRTPMDIGSHSIQVEASFGVAYPPAGHIGPEDILRNANIALHRAKQMGRNRVVVYKPSMHEAAIQIMSLENDIRRGLALGEFFLLYQPIFDLAARQLCGFEALLRWRHPARGLVSPAEFIPVAEDSGLIFELGTFALDQACKEMAELMRAQPGAAHLTLAVNLSPRQFSRQGLTEQIDHALETTGLPPRALVLEITESSIMKHPEASANILSRIKERGVNIALDDFGTGYSSLSALQRLPLDRLKIDMSFVSRITDSAEDREIVRAAITLAKSLHLTTVAEGIETDSQREILAELGCDQGQGFLCAPALPIEEALWVLNPEVCKPTNV
ncbi:MAG TPA: EAL domain-containing protein [Humidesulfovibrio sp.]|uniref:EAL domain-containing protein n=1 Tax=Humidesulfovibrio sp. TaxID=2910988 RepID=UPI002C46CAC8|nr:EAL domain-containing protein [Humidesulfovibrio sp.]HWR03524.1 EAL domain-containing protein [Humidesulfovibrio sp.]